MSYVVPPEFSVYDLVRKSRQASILLNHRRTMSHISHSIEKRLLDENVDGQLFVGFQMMQFFLHRQKTYEKLAKKFRHIYVFAHPDTAAPSIDGLDYIPLQESDALAREWFLVFHGPTYFTALVTEEKTKPGDPNRLFEGLWTFNLDIVSIISEWIVSAIDAKTPDFGGYDLEKHGELMDKNMDDFLQTADSEPEPTPQEAQAIAQRARDLQSA